MINKLNLLILYRTKTKNNSLTVEEKKIIYCVLLNLANYNYLNILFN